MKTWKPWQDVCESCLSPTKVYGENPLTPGDLVFCTGCQCQGTLEVDPWGLYTDWSFDICAKCHRDMDEKLRKVTHDIYIKTRLDTLYRACVGAEPAPNWLLFKG